MVYGIVKRVPAVSGVYEVTMPIGAWMMVTGKTEEELDVSKDGDPVRMGEGDLKVQVQNALEKGEQLLTDVNSARHRESVRLTYADIDFEMTGHHHRGTSDKLYKASEDLAFLFDALATIWAFIHEAEYLFENPEQEAF